MGTIYKDISIYNYEEKTNDYNLLLSMDSKNFNVNALVESCDTEELCRNIVFIIGEKMIFNDIYIDKVEYLKDTESQEISVECYVHLN